jgi:hypothetical protein
MLNKRSFITLTGISVGGCAFRPLDILEGEKLLRLPGSASMRPYSPGQIWTYKKLNFFNSLQVDEIEEKVVSVISQVVIHRKGKDGKALTPEISNSQGLVLLDPYWDEEPMYEKAIPNWPQTLEVNSTISQTTPYRVANSSFTYWVSVRCKVIGFENISLACGSFQTVKVESLISLNHPDFSRASYLRKNTLWISPKVGRWVLRETQGEYVYSSRRTNFRKDDYFRYELIDWA